MPRMPVRRNHTDDIQLLLSKFRSEVMTAAWSFYSWKSINNVAFCDSAVYAALNRNAPTWNIITHSLQTTFFIVLGRIFDVDAGALSVHTFLRKCQDNISQFSLVALRQRKFQGVSGTEPSWLSDYIANAYEPRVADFRKLKKLVGPYQTRYENIYRPVRNQVMAHAQMDSQFAGADKFTNVTIADIQETLSFLYRLACVVEQYFFNGRNTELSDYSLHEEEVVSKDVSRLLGQLRT